MRTEGAKFEDLKGKTIKAIDGAVGGSEHVCITCSDGTEYQMRHHQDCCETVYIYEIHGLIEDVLHYPILLAEEVSEKAETNNHYDSGTWTFYKLSTIKGSVTIRWLGESNGYYSEDVSFERLVA
jgi:hypothetical protein